jgi:PAS domain S-box-containing protein
MAATALNAMIILFSLVFFFQRRVVNPVIELRERAARLASGDKTVRFIRENDRSEVGDLARSLEEFRVAGEMLETKTAELRELNEEQRAIFDSATMGIVLMKDLVIVRCNRRLEELFGYGPGELEGKTTRCWYEDEESYLDAIHDLQCQLSESGCHRKERRLVRKDGSSFWVRGKGRLMNRDNPALGMVGIIDDITMEREAAEAIGRAKEEAEEANRLKSRLVANMSHEMLTPLNAILGLTHLALKSDDLSRSRDYLLKIRESGRYLLGLINNIFDFSGTESGSIALEKEEFDLEELVCRIAKDLNEKAVCKGLEFIINIASDVPRYLIGDPLRIGQILLNFGANAVKFTERGEICLGARVLERGGEDALICFTVRDTGIGLTREELGRLFSGFHQVDMSDTRRYGGAGLGLAISKKLADLMGGGIGAESEYGKGSIFWFSARLGIGKGDTASLIPSLDMRGCRVLVVDDNEINREVAVELLRGAGLRVDTADNGREALEMLKAAGYELVLMDMQMPVMDGVTATGAIRANPLWKDIPVIAMTANVMPSYREECRAAGMNDFIPKPIDPSLLWSALLKWIPPRKGDAEGLSPPESPDASLPLAFDGIDTALGLRLLLDNRDLYISILRKFLLNHGDTAAEIRQALETGDLWTAGRIAHTMKGVAGNIGAMNLHSLAAELERGIRNGAAPEEVERRMMLFREALDALVRELRMKLPPEEAPEPAQVDGEALEVICDFLAELLKQDDADAVELFGENENLLRAAFPEEFGHLEKAIRRYDLDVALATLENARSVTVSGAAHSG